MLMYFQVLCRRCLLAHKRKTLLKAAFPVRESYRRISTSYQLDEDLRALIDNIRFNSKQWKTLVFRLRNCIEDVYSKKGVSLLTVPFVSERKCMQNTKISPVSAVPMEEQNEQISIIKNITLSVEELCHSVNESEKKTVYRNALILLVDSKFPDENVFLYLADIFSLNGNHKGLSLIMSLYKKGDPNEFKSNCSLEHYKAQVSWVNGNFKGALNTFSQVYENSEELKTTVINMIKRLIVHVVEREGTAVVGLVKKFVSEFADRNNDISLEGTLWYAHLLSDWHRDQDSAQDMLLNSSRLQKTVEQMMPHIVANLLLHHRIETFYRLMEMLLKCSMEGSFGVMLRGLFDYYYRMGNVKRCSAVVKCSRDLNVPLSKDQEYKFANLLDSNKKMMARHSWNLVKRQGESFVLKF